MEYRRVISYLYEYHGKEPGKNTGFVRLEVRNGQCRIRVFLKDGGQSQKVGRAVLFRCGGEPGQVLLGTMPVRGSGAEGVFLTQSQNVAGSGLPLGAFCGVGVFPAGSNQVYCSFWDDRRPWKTREEPEAEKAPAPAEASEAEGGTEEEKEMDPEKKPEPENAPEPVEPPDFAENPEPVEPPNFAENPESGSLLEPEKEPGAVEIPKPPNRPEPEKKPEPEKMPEPENARELEEEAEPEKKPAPEEALESEEAKPVEAPGVGEPPGTAEPEEAAADMAAQSLELLGAWVPETHVTWEQLWNTYPKYQPFGPEDPWEVLRISLQDIGRLPREYWHLGSNDFLVNGYCAHRHLILIRDGQEDLYYLGVPGDHLAQDYRVAEMFGFRQYRPAGQAGYWLFRIKL